jgi:hypothetical protein
MLRLFILTRGQTKSEPPDKIKYKRREMDAGATI